MAIGKSRAARSKRTKDELITEMEAIEAKLQGAAPDPTAAAIAKENVTKTREAVKGFSVDTIVSAGAQFGLNVQRTVQGLTEQAVQKAEELKTLQEAIEVETAELERLYQLDVASASIAALIPDHEGSKAALEKEIATARAAWDEEVKAHVKAVTQRNQDVENRRLKDEAEYAYRVQTERQKATDAFNYASSKRERDLEEHVERVNKTLDERAAAIVMQEKDLTDARARIANIDTEIKSKVDAAVAIATNSVKKELVNQFALERKDLDAALGLERQKNAGLVESTTKMAQEIEKLHAQLAAAKQQVTDITVKALESASGQQALASVQALVKENGSNGRNGAKA